MTFLSRVRRWLVVPPSIMTEVPASSVRPTLVFSEGAPVRRDFQVLTLRRWWWSYQVMNMVWASTTRGQVSEWSWPWSSAWLLGESKKIIRVWVTSSACSCGKLSLRSITELACRTEMIVIFEEYFNRLNNHRDPALKCWWLFCQE